MDFIEFWTVCSANGIVLSVSQMEMLKRYHSELIYWNQKVNLISRKDEPNLLDRHILHSLSCLKYLSLPRKAKCIDVGTGGGLPGIPLKIAREDLRMTLVDSIAKKTKITGMLARHTGLNNISAFTGRAEGMLSDPSYRHSFDFVFARNVAKAAQLIGWTKGLLKPEGTIVLFKGGDLTAEIAEAESQHSDITCKVIDINLFGADWFLQNGKKLVLSRIR